MLCLEMLMTFTSAKFENLLNINLNEEILTLESFLMNYIPCPG